MQEFCRRQLLKAGAGIGAAAALAACAPVGPDTGMDSADVMDEQLDLVVWYQDWDGANRIMGWVQPEFEKDHDNVTVDLQAIGYGDLLNKMLPSIASGTEGDVMMMYTDWVVATDITRVFLDITDAAGGAAELEEKVWPVAPPPCLRGSSVSPTRRVPTRPCMRVPRSSCPLTPAPFPLTPAIRRSSWKFVQIRGLSPCP